MDYGNRPPVGPTPTLLSISQDLVRPTPRIENLGVGSHTKKPGVGLETRGVTPRAVSGEKYPPGKIGCNQRCKSGPN